MIEIWGRPMPWKAPTVTKRGAYSAHSERKMQIQWQMKTLFNRTPFEGPIFLEVLYFFAVPKNTSFVKKKQMLNGMIKHTKRPDRGNLDKLLEDCGNGILWKDDSQNYKILSEKSWGEEEKTIIKIHED